MNDDAFSRLETEAAEILGALKHLFREFERQLGEAVSAQRLSSSEARNEAADARALLRELVQRAQETADGQQQTLAMLRENWWFNIEENAKASGAGMAREFGKQIAAGPEERLEALSADVERATRRFGWSTILKWGAGLGVGNFLVILVGVYAFTPHVEGFTADQAQAALAELVPCEVGKKRHICIKLGDRPEFVKGSGGAPRVVVREL